MIGLIYLAAGLIYLLITFLFTVQAVKLARRRGLAGWKWGLPVFLVMFLLVFWDWIPTVAVHNYYCAKYAGLTVHATPDEWVAENPGVEENLTWVESADRFDANGQVTYILNERLNLISSWVKLPLSMSMKVQQIVDQGTGDIVAERKDVFAGVQPIGLGIRSIRDLKIWLSPYKTCVNRKEIDKWVDEGKTFPQIAAEFKRIGRKRDN